VLIDSVLWEVVRPTGRYRRAQTSVSSAPSSASTSSQGPSPTSIKRRVPLPVPPIGAQIAAAGVTAFQPGVSIAVATLTHELSCNTRRALQQHGRRRSASRKDSFAGTRTGLGPCPARCRKALVAAPPAVASVAPLRLRLSGRRSAVRFLTNLAGDLEGGRLLMSWRGTRTSRVRIAAAGLSISAAGLILSGSPALAAVGDITEYTVPTASSAPFGIAAGLPPSGNVYFVENAANKVAKVSISGAFTEYAIPTANSNSLGITAGPDGNLWFTEGIGNVAKVTTSGSFTEFAVPGAGPSGPPLAGWAPTGITAGPDGNLWFTLNRSGSCGSLGRVTTLGAVTLFPLPFPCNQPDGIVTGPDGKLWFTEPASNKVGNMTTAGVVTEYVVPTSGTLSHGITVGPDGNLWFTENGGQKVANVTTAGAFTEYPAAAGSDPQFIAAGPDGNLWFTEGAGNKVARVTTSGAITEYTVPTGNSTPTGIAVGPDSNLWFTENSASKVAKIVAVTTPNIPEANQSALFIAAGGVVIACGLGLVAARRRRSGLPL
jgi:streptogramin lyase